MEFDFTSETLERVIIRKLLIDKKFLAKISSCIDNRWFESSKSLGVLAKLIIKYYNAYDALPNTKIVEAMIAKYCQVHADVPQTDVLRELNEVMRMDLDLSLDSVTTNLNNFIKEKRLYYKLCDKSAEILNHGSLDKFMDEFDDINKFTLEDTNIGMKYFDKEYQKKHWEYIKSPESRISTGFPGLDKYLNGGFYRKGKMLACIMGQAGLGKSLFLSNIAVNCLKNDLRVVVISLEMSEDIYATRFDAHISDTNINRLAENCDTVIDRIDSFYKAHPDCNLIIKEYPPRSKKIVDIQIFLDNLIATGQKFDIIIVDYLNLIRPNKSRDNMYQDVLDVAEKLRALSYIYEVPIVTATQANRQGANNNDIGMEHVSESKGIGDTVDFFGGLYQMDEDRENGIINMRILKNRLGGCVNKVVPFKMDPQSLILRDTTFTPEDALAHNAEAETIISNFQELSDDIDSDSV